VFHRPGCKYYNCTDCTIIFKSKDQALTSKFRPCKICKP
jgi:methylphosphotriester-DNA--protein-cysteine methyltransferase